MADTLPWGRFAPLLSVQLIGTLGYSIALPFLVFLVSDLGGATWTYGLLGATYSIFQLLGAPLLGRWSDRVGRRRILVVSQVGTMLAWLLMFGALQLPKEALTSFFGAAITLPLILIFAARALDGLTGGNVAVANALVVDMTRESPELRQVAFGRMAMAASLGFVLGPAIAGVLGAIVSGYEAPILFAALIAFVATLLITRLEEPLRTSEDEPTERVTSCAQDVLAPGHDVRPEALRERHVLREPAVLVLLVATFVQFVGYNLFFAGFPVHAERALSWSASQMGAFFALLAMVMLVAEGPVLSFVSARTTPARTFTLGAAALTASFACWWLGQSQEVMYAGAVLYALGNGLAWPTFQARLSEVADDASQGIVQGAATSAGSLASILGLIAGALLYDRVTTGLFLASAVIFGVITLVGGRWFREAEA